MSEEIVPGALYVVATPLGNLEDITYRAVRILGGVSRVLCEDTRKTRVLCEHYGVTAPLLRHDAHTEARSAQGAIALLAAGESLALVSDAGTPGVCDPGARLVRDVVAAGHRVIPVPGASAVTALLSVSGRAAPGFAFGGFLPKPKAALDALLAALPPGVHAFFVPARDLAAALERLATHHPGADVVAGRELTKLHEHVYRGLAADAAAAVAADPHGDRGEAVIVVEVPPKETDDDAIRAALAAERARGLSQKAAIAAVTAALGVRRARVYALALDADG
ncbi:MAG: rRNA small subunit methyltransferase 1 [Myxococcales bacterium]|nr:rRNA small subunit methyltransferase 1 [Myxococcales bacterium]MCB9732981.1 rRNA small subunit methyltransferase 1 [Deltaproteobacteria bacterium]